MTNNDISYRGYTLRFFTHTIDILFNGEPVDTVGSEAEAMARIDTWKVGR